MHAMKKCRTQRWSRGIRRFKNESEEGSNSQGNPRKCTFLHFARHRSHSPKKNSMVIRFVGFHFASYPRLRSAAVLFTRPRIFSPWKNPDFVFFKLERAVVNWRQFFFAIIKLRFFGESLSKQIPILSVRFSIIWWKLGWWRCRKKHDG